MGLRMRKSVKIAPGVRVNLGTKSAGISVGGKGFRYSVNSSGRRTTTVGIPGTGISYSSSSRSKHSSAQAKRQKLERERARAAQAQEKERLKQLELEHARAIVEEYEAKIDAITSIHRGASEPYCWKAIYETPAPFQLGEQGAREIEARQKQENYKPGFFAKHFRSLNDSQNGKLDAAVQAAIEEDKKEYEEWADLHALAEGVVNMDTDAMLDAIERSGVFQDLAEYGSGFEIGFINSSAIEVEFDIMADTVVPGQSFSLTSTGKLSQKNLAVSKRLDIMQDYVCSSVLRIARELFAILPVDIVLVHARDSFFDTSVGKNEPQDILSVLFKRENMDGINFDAIDPSDSMVNFHYTMKFLKTKGFQPIKRIIATTIIDKETGNEHIAIEK